MKLLSHATFSILWHLLQSPHSDWICFCSVVTLFTKFLCGYFCALPWSYIKISSVLCFKAQRWNCVPLKITIRTIQTQLSSINGTPHVSILKELSSGNSCETIKAHQFFMFFRYNLVKFLNKLCLTGVFILLFCVIIVTQGDDSE